MAERGEVVEREVGPWRDGEVLADLAEELRIPVEGAAITAFDLFVADEVFTCSTSGAALGVREVAGRTVRGGAPGPVTRKLNELYWRKREAGWHGTRL